MTARRFTKEFEIEAVRLARTIGLTHRRVAEDFGIGLSTLVRWLGRHRARPGGDANTALTPDVIAELRRLRRENEVLRQERDILKKATAFFVRKRSR